MLVSTIHESRPGRLAADTKARAIRASKHGWAVVAVRGKVPIEKWAHLDWRSPRALREQWPSNADGVGILAGPSNLVCIDIDPPHGEESLAELYGPCPDFSAAWTQETPSGGRHLIFTQSKDRRIRSCNAYLPGIDIKADGGMFILYGDFDD